MAQTGHSDKIRAVAWSPDGRVIASGGSDRRIKLWDAATGTLLRTLTGHRKRVESLAFSRDGRWLASTGPDSTLRVWDVEAGSVGATQERKQVEAPAVAFSPDGTRLAWAVGSDVELWDPALSKLQGRLEGDASGVVSLSFSADGRTLAGGSRKGSIQLWDASSAARRGLLTGDKDAAASIAFSPDGTTLASASGSGIALWDVAAARVRRRIDGHTAGVLSVAWSSDGKLIASSAGDNTVRLWDASGNARHTLQGHAGRFGWVYAVSFSPDSGRLASGAEDAVVKVWDVRDGAERGSFGGRADRVEAVAFSPDGRLVALGGLGIDSELQLWNADGALAFTLSPPERGSGGPSLSAQEERFAAESLETNLHAVDKAQFDVRSPRLNFSGGIWAHGETMRRILAGFPGTVRSIAFSPDGARLISGSLSRVVRAWDPLTGSHIRTLTAHSGVVRAIAMSPDGKTFASGGEDGALKLWNASNFYLHRNTARAHEGPLMSLAFSRDGRWLASGAEKDEHVKIWNVESGAVAHALPGHRGGVDGVAFAPDGRTLVVASLDVQAGKNSLRFWDPASGREQGRMALDEWPVAVCFSPEGRTLAVGTYAGTVRLHDWPGAALRRTLLGHAGPVWSVAFSPSGELLLSGSDDTTARYWSAQTGEQLATATGSGKEWLVLAADGLFDGSSSGWSNVRWRFSENLFDIAPVEMFFSEFYHPGLLGELLAGKRPRAPRDIGQLDRRPPAVALRTAGDAASAASPPNARNLPVRVEVAEAAAEGQRAASGARDVRLFRNGSLVKLWRGDVLKGKPAISLEAEVPIIAGENRFTAYAFNRDNIKSADATLLVKGADSLKRAGTAYILAIGVNRYANADYNLSYAVADAQAFAEELRKQQAALGSFGGIEVVPLLDQEATKANILSALARLSGSTQPPPAKSPAALQKLKRAEPEDAVFVYYAGHGTAQGPRFYLIPHDLGYAGKRAALESAALKTILSRSISDLDLEQAFEKVDAGRLLLVIDACNSGQALEAEEKRRGPMNSKGLAQLAYEKGMYILAASQGYQAALEAAQLGHGYLTYALVEEGLKSAAADGSPKDGQVVLREWLDYATQRVPQLQAAQMGESRKAGRELAFVEGEQSIRELEKRSLQRPRVFYRREAEPQPLVVAKPSAAAPKN